MEDENKMSSGLANTPTAEYPKVGKKAQDLTPIQRLANPETHARVKDYLCARIKMSETEMNKFKPRWQVNEKKYQAYVTLPKYEEALKQMNDTGAPPKVVSVVIPYTFATVSTIVTYLIHTFAGRKPMFQVGAPKAASAGSARNMELVLQYNADHTRLIKHLFQFLLDGQQYGVSIMRCQWQREERIRTIWKSQPVAGYSTPQKVKLREKAVTYEGNDVCSIDPYMFYPDPRVPMSEVNRRGEWVFWKSYEGKHILKTLEHEGKVHYVDKITTTSRDPYGVGNLNSDRSLRSGGESEPGTWKTTSGDAKISDNIELFQGSAVIIPAELGLGDENYPVKYLFTIANRGQIIQAQPLDLDHDMHPVVVSEPYTMGYSFGHLGIADYLNPMQDTMSWLINSHMDNVKTALNNMFVFDPSRIETQDMKEPGAGKLIRAKKAAYGTNISDAIKQFQVQDVTQGHIRDFQLFMKIGDTMSSVTDNLRGLQDSGGRKTATEVRTSGEAAASRLAALARFISAQAITDLTEQMCLNNQQNLSDEFFIEIAGQDGLKNHIRISPEHLTGDFQYPIHDGTLPLDRVALLDVWKEIFLGVAQDQELRGRFDVFEMFKHIAELGGAKDISRFEVQAAPDAQVEQQVQAGNIVPGPTNQTPGINANQGQRLLT